MRQAVFGKLTRQNAFLLSFSYLNSFLIGVQGQACHDHARAGLRGMAAADNIARGEVLVSLPVTAALVVSPKERCQLPSTFCSSAFYSKKPWYTFKLHISKC